MKIIKGISMKPGLAHENRISTEVRGHLFLIGINRPDKLNAFDIGMLHGLSNAYTELENRADLRCGVIFAHGKDFTAGLDLASVMPVFEKERSIVPEGNIDPWGVFGPMVSKPTVCAVQGRCLTLGIELMLASDIRIASRDATFAQIEIKRGIFPFGGATVRMPFVAGWGNAMRYLLTGDTFDAGEALRIGIVQEVVEPGRQLGHAVEIAEVVAKQAPLGVRATIRSSRAAASDGPKSAIKELLPEILELMKTEDAKEGVQSFLERREADFKGK